MKKLTHKTTVSEPDKKENELQEPFEIIYADPRDEEIHLKFLNRAQISAHMARWFLDYEYNQLLWSDGIYEILEIDSRRSGASYGTYLDIVHPEDRAIKDSAQKELLDTKKPIEITYRLLMKDGRIKWINEICNTDFDKSGNPIRFYGIIQDITRYKLSEEKFKQKEERYKTLIDSLPIGICIYQNKKMVFINPAAVRLLGATKASDLVEKPIIKMTSPEFIKIFRQKMEKVAIGETIPSFEEKLIRIDGSVFDAEIIATHTNYEGSTAVQIIINDITERKITEQALKKSEEKFRLLTTNLSDVVWTVNSEGLITYISPSVEQLIGYNADEVINAKITKFFTTTSALTCLIKLEEAKSTIIQGRKMEPCKISMEAICKDTTTKWTEVSGNAMYDSSENFVGFSGICQNITERRKAEQILQENENKLKELIATKDKFFSIIAHDLRSPFVSILGFLELLQTQYDEFNDSERKKYISLISENADTTLNLLENLLVWAKTQTGRIAYMPVKQKLLPIVNSVNNTLKSSLQLKKITLNILVPDDIEIIADTNMLFTIFQNLISNAIKYSNPGNEVLFKAQILNKTIEIIVADSGIGIDEHTKNKLFKVDEQISEPGTANEKGSGLGLILCKDFIVRHNGSIHVESELGKGSQFIIKLPQA